MQKIYIENNGTNITWSEGCVLLMFTHNEYEFVWSFYFIDF